MKKMGRGPGVEMHADYFRDSQGPCKAADEAQCRGSTSTDSKAAYTSHRQASIVDQII
jgi:hypothetical protein